jgi:YD repeat-containing protein
MVYPNGRTVTDSYGTAGALDDTISRLDALVDQGGAGPTLEALTYLGLNTVVQRAHPEANLTLSYINAPGGSTDGGDQYTGLDRFGRVVDQYWSVGATATDSFQYMYDRDSNPLMRTNALQGALSEHFGYDSLNRVTSFTLGSHSQSWMLDSQGNWQTYTTDGQAQARTHNAQNQIASLTQPGLGTPGYDADGNTTTDEYGDTFKFDAWNRLVRATTAGGTVYGYSYDALGRRITSQVNTGSTTDLYYSANWQVVEEQVSGVMTAQYVWSPVYVDALVERDTPSYQMDGGGGWGCGGGGVGGSCRGILLRTGRHRCCHDGGLGVGQVCDHRLLRRTGGKGPGALCCTARLPTATQYARVPFRLTSSDRPCHNPLCARFLHLRRFCTGGNRHFW